MQTICSEQFHVHFMNRHVFLNLYKQFVRCHLEFSVSAWCPWINAYKSGLSVRALDFLEGATKITDPFNLLPSRSRLEIRSNFFRQKVVNMWNSLPGDLKNSRNLKVFKANYKRFPRDAV